jgi:hypothetical protein
MRTIATITCLILWVAPAAAFEVHPGKWEIVWKTKSSVLPEAQTQTRTECIKERTANEILGTLTEKDICTIHSHSENGDTLEWKMDCRQQGSPPMSGDGRLTSHGETFDGGMNVSMKLGEEEMNK